LLFVVNCAAFFLSHRRPIADAARALGYDVHVATADGPAVVDIVAAGYPHHVLPLTRWSTGPISECRTLLSLIGLYRRLQPDIVHHVTVKPVIYGGIAARIARVPAVVSAISGLGYLFADADCGSARERMGLINKLYRAALGHSNSCVIFQNSDDRRVLTARGIASARHQVLIPGSGVDLNHYCPAAEPDGVPMVVMASRLLWQKGVGEFVEAARLLKEGEVKARFLLVGGLDPGNPNSVPRETLQAWAAEGVIEWTGFRTDIADVFRQSHVVVFPSYREGVPKVLLEAAACGRPIVTTEVPGCRDVVRDGENGFLVPAEDAAALASKVRVLIEDGALRRRMGAVGRRRAEREFCVREVVRRHLEIYASLLGGGGVPQYEDAAV
jgi:glycosyltransferase involved in cell wall biosynthesis